MPAVSLLAASSPLVAAALACAAVAGACWLLSVLTREYSWVDRIWSIVPPLYVAWFAAQTNFADERLLLMTVLAALWGARLTYNFARKGGYAPGGEDYRWAALRKLLPPPVYQVFNFVFIAAYQNLLLLLLALPAWVALQCGTPLGPLDAVATALLLFFLAGETIADEQQWQFHEDKRRRKAAGEPVPREFLTTGLFRYSRHPNFFCEQAIWWSFYLFSVSASGLWLQPGLIGPVLLTLLFLGSTAFTEHLTRAKYPDYADYQRRTSRLLPWAPRA